MEKADINSLSASKVPKLCDLIQLEVGAAHFLALKKSIIPGIKDFDTEELIEWMATAGFPECQNVVKFGKITGEILAKHMAEGNDFLAETLGVFGENETIKFRT